MPLVYPPRRRSSSGDTLSTENTLEPTDADDSIVLSDLVRTGEQSRLRRRGAIRIDHGSQPDSGAAETDTRRQTELQPQPQPLESAPAPALILVSPSWGTTEPDWEPEAVPSEEEYRTWRTGWGSRQAVPNAGDFEEREFGASAESSGRRGGVGDEDIYEYTLYCGGEDTTSRAFMNDKRPFEPSILPSYPSEPSAPSTSIRHTNGCGAVVHVRAAPRRRLGVWMAKSSAESNVVALDASYFDQAAVAKILRSACGCVREGVGCANCGNPLGTRYKPCQAAAEGIFSPPPAAPRPSLRPDGPDYYHPRHSRSMHSSPFYMYTFFDSAVTASPPYTFPAHAKAETRPATPTFNLFDRILTASPAPMSDDGEGGYGAAVYVDQDLPPQAPEEPNFDPDGETILAPSSPDKGAEPPLFPER